MVAFNTAANSPHNERSLYYGLRRQVVEKRAFIMAADHPAPAARAGRGHTFCVRITAVSLPNASAMPPPRTREEIRADILTLESETEGLLDEIIGMEKGG